MTKHIFYPLTLVILASVYSFAQDARVLIIGIDGCRSDVLATASTPNIDNLMQTGYYTLNGLTESPTWSGVGWTGMVTGVWKNKHGVNDNTYIGQNLSYPHFFKHINDQNSNLNKYSIVHWGPINTHLANFSAGEQQFTYGTDLEVENKVADVFATENPDVVFVHFDDVDHAGHDNGFLVTEPAYVAAIETADTRVGNILSALYARPNYASENWLIIVSTDHGGTASGHGGSSIEERTIFIVAAGDIDQIGEATISESIYEALAHVSLDGSSSSYLDVGDPTGQLVIGSNDFTVECWVKTNGWTGDPSIISNKNWDNGFNEGFILAGTTNGSSWKFNIGSGIVRYDLDGSTIDDGEWHHLAVTVDRNGDIIAYQDGIITDQETIIGAIDVDSDLDLCFGQDGTTTYGDGIEAGLSEVRIWNAALPQEALIDYMCTNLDANHPFNSNLVGHWPLDENSGTTGSTNLGSNHAQFSGNASWESSGTDRTCFDVSSIPEMVDITYTALTHLCLDIEPSWQLDGKVFGVNPCSIASIEELSNSILPNSMLVNGVIDVESKEISLFNLYNSNGKLITTQSARAFSYSLPSIGIYFLNQSSENGSYHTTRIINR
jgi:hypothetical protein